ncbi:MAG: hypothetical protein AAGA70_17910, partial [Pseudomonadota bacterium]
MSATDWISAAVNLVIGFFLGIAAMALLALIQSGAWLIGLFIVAAIGTVFLFANALDGLSNRLFRSGVRPPKNPARTASKPPLRRLSLPLGLALGVLVERLGMSGTILDML